MLPLLMNASSNPISKMNPMQRTENYIYVSPVRAAGAVFAAAVLQRQKESKIVLAGSIS